MIVYVNNGAMGTVEHSGAASAIALSVPVAAGALLLKLESVLGIGVSLMLLLALALAFIGGAALARWRPLQNGRALVILRYGFLLATAAGLLTLLMLFGGHAWPALLPGIALGGLGLGVAYRTAAGALDSISRLTMLASIVVAVAVALLIQTYAAPGVSGFYFAFALLADLTLLGALIARIAERDEG
ncbi:hypothetical protein [Serratia ficaria]|uniref:hypothetical protein n=1 Tax=Serratia ficaria TaxID=61651 RepID=UPI002177DF66|nr:hypothetical protein [Serratia ficaria]CAI1595520.1 Uncharacterised protein [Serratia ficaria]